MCFLSREKVEIFSSSCFQILCLSKVDELKDRVVDVRPSSSHSKAWLSSSFLQQPGDDGTGGALRTTRGRGSGKDAWVNLRDRNDPYSGLASSMIFLFLSDLFCNS